MIYFVQSPAGGPIKIGTTIRLSVRLAQLFAEHGRLVVLAVLDGSYADESALHQRFAHLRGLGEWFLPGKDLLEFIWQEGLPWDGVDESPTGTSVKIDRAICHKAKQVAVHRSISFTDYLCELLGDPVDRDYQKMREAMDDADEKEGGGK